MIVGASIRAVILIGEEAERIETAIRTAGNFTGDIDTSCDSMQAAVTSARRHAQTGDAILLSPACASFGMFANYKDRGERFRNEVMRQGSTKAEPL